MRSAAAGAGNRCQGFPASVAAGASWGGMTTLHSMTFSADLASRPGAADGDVAVQDRSRFLAAKDPGPRACTTEMCHTPCNGSVV